MSDVFNEVDEELRREQANRLFKRFLPYIIALIVVIVGGVSAVQGWTWWQEKQRSEAADTYARAAKLLEQKDFAAAAAAFTDFAQTGPSGYAALSKVQAAIATMNMGRKAEAAKLFTEAASAFDDPLFSDLAMLKAVMVVYDEISLADMDAKLGPLMEPGRPFRALARELMASKSMDEGDFTRARQEYSVLSMAFDAPSGTRQRAQMALSLLGPAPEEALLESVSKLAEPAVENTGQEGDVATDELPEDHSAEHANPPAEDTNQ